MYYHLSLEEIDREIEWFKSYITRQEASVKEQRLEELAEIWAGDPSSRYPGLLKEVKARIEETKKTIRELKTARLCRLFE